MRHRHVATLLAVLSGLPLAGCIAPYGPETLGPQTIAPAQSIVHLPEPLAEAPLAVRRQVESGTWQERMVLTNDTALPGENAIVVQTRWRGDPYYLFKSGRFSTPYTERGIDRRITQEFVGSRVSPPVERANHHGRYRYVEATRDNVRCVFAWQMIDATASLTGKVHSYALDFRYCDPERDVDDLLALFDQLELQPFL